MSRFFLRPGSARISRTCGGAAAFITVLALGSALTAQVSAPASSKPKPSASGAAPADLPSARSVLDRHVEAIGGRAAVLSHSSTYAQGTLAMPAAGITGRLEIFAARPDKSLLKISIEGVGDVIEAFNGTHGWSVSPMTGPMLLEGKALEEKRFDAEYYGELRNEGHYVSMTTLEQAEFDGRPCYKLRLVRKAGGEDFEFYDAATGLKAGSITTRETPMGAVTGTSIETDYRRFGKLLQPTTVRSTVGALEQVITISVVEYDTVPASAFDMPAEIRALLK